MAYSRRNFCEATPVYSKALLLLLLSSSQVLAQTPTSEPIEEAPPDLLEEYTVTATRYRERVFNVPTATTILRANQIKERTHTSLADLFRGETGIFVRATNPSAGSPIIRGVTGRDVLMLVDGFRLSHAFMRPNTQYQGLVDPYFAEQIEIVRGPNSTLYGSDAMGGVTNVLTANFQAGVRTRTEYLSNPAGVSQHLNFGLGEEKDTFKALVGLTYRSFGDVVLGSAPDPKVFFPNPGRTIANTGYEYYGGNFKSIVQLTPDQTLTLTAQYSRIPTVSRQDGILQGYGTNVPSVARGFAPQSRTFILGEYKANYKDAWLDNLSFKVGFQQVEDNRYQRNYSTAPSFGNPVGIASNTTSLEGNASNLVGTILQFQSNSGQHRFTYGAEAYFDQVRATRSNRNEITGSIAPDPNGPRYVDGSTLNQYGIFVQDEIFWSDRFETVLGLRYSTVDVNIPFSSIRPLSSGFSRNFAAVTGNLGAIYKLTPEVNLVFNVGQGFRAPNINDLGEAGARRVTDINIPNNSLSAEKVLSVDGGFKWRGSAWSGELYAFWSDYTDRIESVALGTVLNTNGTTSQIFQSQNRGSGSLWGLEFGTRYRFDPAWSTFVSANFVTGSSTGENALPPFNGVLGVRWEPATGIYVEPYVRYANAQTLLSVNDLTDRRINPNGTPGFIITNLRTGIPLSPTTTLRLNVDNLFNQTYRENGTTLDGSGTAISVGFDSLF